MKASIVQTFVFAACIAGCGAASSPPPPPPSSGTVAWSIFNAADGGPTTCDGVSATTISLALAKPSGGAPVVVALPCARGNATFDADVGTYTVTPELLAADGTVLATAPGQTVVIPAGQPASLASLVFAATPLSGFVALSIANGTSGQSNCQAAGAGMTGVSLWLERSGNAGGCVPTTFVRSRAGAQTGTYAATSCSSPAVEPCIETDERLTAGMLSPGTYLLHVHGNKGADQCWNADETLTLAAGRPFVGTVSLVRGTGPGC